MPTSHRQKRGDRRCAPTKKNFSLCSTESISTKLSSMPWLIFLIAHRAEEIAQDTFHTAVGKIDTLMKADEPIRWLKRTAKNKIRNAQRADRQRYLKRYLSLDAPETPAVSSAGSVEDAIIEQEDKQQRASVEETIRQTLTPTEITMLKRIAIERACYSDVAQELGISLWACQKRMQRIRQKLSEEFPDHKKKKK